MASMTKSQSFNSLISWQGLIWLKISKDFSVEIFPFSANLSNVDFKFFRDFSVCEKLASYKKTSQCAVAATCAMPIPIVPEPMIPTFFII